VIPHDSKEIARPGLSESEEIDVPAHLLIPPGPPSEWEFDEFGAPQWIVGPDPLAGFAPWATIIPMRGAALEDWQQPWLAPLLDFGPAQMPRVSTGLANRLAGVSGARKRGRGNPGLQKTQRELVRVCAWLTDVRAARLDELEPLVAGPLANASNRRRQARSFLDNGRRLLHDEGVLPWMLWPEGALPASWSLELCFIEGFHAWYFTYLIRGREALEALLEQHRAAVRYARSKNRLRRHDRVIEG